MPNWNGGIGGPIDPDAPAPDPGHLLALIAAPTTEWHADHLRVRGQDRWLAIVGGFWTVAEDGKVRIDAETFAKLRGPGVYQERRQILVGTDRYGLVCAESAGLTWAVLEPAIGGPSDPDVQAGA